MAELEIHHEGLEEHNPFAQKVGILAAVLAALLAIVTIASHRAHTDAVILKSEANDQWSFYQAQRLKFHNLELGRDLIAAVAPANDKTAQLLARYDSDKQKYEQAAEKVQQKAEGKEHESERIEQRALRFDLGEGLLEIALVLTSLYFISKRKLFPAIGVIAGVIGILIAASGWV